MSNINLPQPPVNLYDQTKRGFYGQLGQSDSVIVRYLQTGLSKMDLLNIRLIRRLRVAKSGKIKDLFQRNVDHSRVINEILPYLDDPTTVKYFDPFDIGCHSI